MKKFSTVHFQSITSVPFNKFSTYFILLLFLSAGLCVSVVNAQENLNVIKDIVPPPLEKISKLETEQLNSQTDLKKRTQLAIEFMENRLKNAETFSNEQKYQESLEELGSFQALMKNAMKYMERNDTGSKKVLNSFKRFEINLRSFVPRLELVRRIMPEKFAYHVVQLMKSVRKTRSNAVEPLFSDSVVSSN